VTGDRVPRRLPPLLFALLAAAYLSQWTITTVDATNITLVKGTGVGSGAAGAQLRLFVARPQSVTR